MIPLGLTLWAHETGVMFANGVTFLLTAIMFVAATVVLWGFGLPLMRALGDWVVTCLSTRTRKDRNTEQESYTATVQVTDTKTREVVISKPPSLKLIK